MISMVPAALTLPCRRGGVCTPMAVLKPTTSQTSPMPSPAGEDDGLAEAYHAECASGHSDDLPAPARGAMIRMPWLTDWSAALAAARSSPASMSLRSPAPALLRMVAAAP